MGARRVLQGLLLAALVAFVIVNYGRWLYTNSSDLGWHYSLTDFIASNQSLPTPADSHLGPMLRYPPGSHLMAAVTSKLAGSPLTAMHALALASALGCYLIF